MMRRLGVVLTAGLAAAVLSLPSSSQAVPPGDWYKAVRSCDKNIQKEVVKFYSDLIKRFGKCTDQTLLEQFKEKSGSTPDYAKRAAKCEDQLGKALNDKRAAFVSKIGAAATGDCSVKLDGGGVVLNEVGHLRGGTTAPGGTLANWLSAKLLTFNIFSAMEWLYSPTSPNGGDTFDLLVRKSENDDSPSGLTKLDCTKDPGSLPLLCMLNRDTNGTAWQDGKANTGSAQKGALTALCRYNTCDIDADSSGGQIKLPFGLTVGVALDGLTVTQNCSVKDVPFISELLGGKDWRISRSPYSRGVKPAVLGAGDQVVCIETHHGEGWCDCTGDADAVPIGYDWCQDHILGNGNECTIAANSSVTDTPEECFCTASMTPLVPCGGLAETQCSPTNACKSDADCGGGEFCASTAAGVRCHPGTVQRTVVTPTGSSTQGDCFGGAASALTVTQVGGDDNGICSAAGGSPGEFCTVGGGSNPPGCVCLSLIGADGVVCTDDDLLPRGDPSGIPQTSGIVNAQVLDAAEVLGNCSGNGKFCIENQNCPAGETCDNVQLGTITSATEAGLPIDCEDSLAGEFVGYQFVNCFAFNDASGLGDGTSCSRFRCEDD